MAKLLKAILTAIMATAQLLTFPLFARAEVFDTKLIPLYEQNLLLYLENEGYENYYFYQPSLREAESSGYTLSIPDICPILATKGDGIYTLLIVEKQGANWTITTTNDEALSRSGYVLCGFSIEELGESINAYFSFNDGDDLESELGLQISNVYPSQFTFFHSGAFQIVFNYDRGITATIDAPFLGRFSYEMQIDGLNCDVSSFSLSTCPLSIVDITSSGNSISHSDDIALFAIPDDSLEPVFYISETDDIFLLNYQAASDWAMVAYNHNIFFVHHLEATYND